MSDPTPVRAIFFADPAAAAAALTSAVRSGEAGDEIRGALGQMPEAAKAAVLGEVGSVAAGILDLDVADIFGQAWTKQSALRHAAAATLADAGTEQIVGLVTHTMSFSHEPEVEIHVADIAVATIAVRVELEIVVQGLLAVVRGGRLVAIRAGTADVTGSLAIAGRPVAERQVTLDLPGLVRLGAGVPLGERVR